MKAVLAIPARMTSARLPGKVLAPIEADGETHPMLWYQVQRLRKSAAEVVIATTEDASDDPIAALARDMKVRCVRGSSLDLISRHAKVARETQADVYVLSGGDDPLLEWTVVDALVGGVMAGLRFVSSKGWPLGMNAWAWEGGSLAEADAESTDPDEREHVNPWYFRRPQRYPSGQIEHKPNLYETYRLTVDFAVDLTLMRKIFAELWPVNRDFGLYDIVNLLALHPHWKAINDRAPQYFPDMTPVDEGPVTTQVVSGDWYGRGPVSVQRGNLRVDIP